MRNAEKIQDEMLKNEGSSTGAKGAAEAKLEDTESSTTSTAPTPLNELEQLIKVMEDELEALVVEKIARLDQEIWDALDQGDAVRSLHHGVPIERDDIKTAIMSSVDPITKINNVDIRESVSASTRTHLLKARETKAELRRVLRETALIKKWHRLQWRAATNPTLRAEAISTFTLDITRLRDDFPLRDKPAAVAKAFASIFAAAVAIVGTLVGGLASVFIGGGAKCVDAMASTQYANRYNQTCKKLFNNVWDPIIHAATFTTDSKARIGRGKEAVQEESQKITTHLLPR